MKRLFYYFSVFCIASLFLGLAAAYAVFEWASRDLPNFTKIADYRPKLVTTVYARDNSIMGYFYDEKRFLVNLDQIPRNLALAFLAAEDDGFYQHHGIDPVAILRAFLANLRSGATSQGGSTITQQVVKRLLLTNEKTYERKIKEAILAYRLTKYLTKDEVLTIYLNQIYLGANSYGVEAAARTYFGKHVQDLTLAEAAVLAGLPQAPSSYNPFRNPAPIKGRQKYVLDRMLYLKWVTPEEHQEALNTELVYRSMPEPSWGLGAWYLEEVRRRLIDFFSEENIRRLGLSIDRYGKEAVQEAGLHIYTGMDPEHQLAGELALRNGLLEATKRHGWRGPVLQLPTSEWNDYLEKEAFTPAALDNAGWAKALVTKVVPGGAEVRLGSYRGYIDVSTMGWARQPNPKVNSLGAGKVSNSTKVLNPGDVVWVSAVGAKGTTNPVSVPAADKVPAYDPKTIGKDSILKLALEQYPDVEGALASIETENGDLVALVGGYSFSQNSQFNRATQARRQPGSSFKPIVYSAALDNGFTAGSIVNDTPFVTFGPTAWRPGNADGVFLGPMLVRTALAKSRNLCTIQIAQKIGIGKVVERARELGLEESPIPHELAISLGAYAVSPLAMTEAYSAFANGGKMVRPRLVTRIDDSWNNTLVNFAPDAVQVISPQNAYVMSYMLKEVVNAGTGGRAKVLGRPVGGKTGTTNEEKDAWFLGISPYLTTGVYIGYDQIRPMGRNEGGSRAALPVFVDYRKAIDAKYPPEDFSMPEGITVLKIDGNSGYLAGPDSQSVFAIPFIKGTEPTIVSGQQLQRGQDDNQAVEDLYRIID